MADLSIITLVLLAAREDAAVEVEVIVVGLVELGADGHAKVSSGAGVDLAQEARFGA
jgi:hypothetical protein